MIKNLGVWYDTKTDQVTILYYHDTHSFFSWHLATEKHMGTFYVQVETSKCLDLYRFSYVGEL